MGWVEQRGKKYRLSFRYGGRMFRHSLGVETQKEADERLAVVERNLRLLEEGVLELPRGAVAVVTDGPLMTIYLACHAMDPANADEITARVPDGLSGRFPGRCPVSVPRGQGDAAPPSQDRCSGAPRPIPRRARARLRHSHAPRDDPLQRDRALPRIIRAAPAPRGRSGELPAG